MKVDTVVFEREIIKWGNDEQELLCAKITINDMPLIESVRAYELPYAKKYNQESIAGSYIYNYASYLHKLLSGIQKPMDYEKEIPILLCQCGSEGCWDFIMTIEETETAIIWKDLHNPRRSAPDSPGGFWDYSNFPSFHFDKKQYRDEIDKLAEMKAL